MHAAIQNKKFYQYRTKLNSVEAYDSEVEFFIAFL